MLSTGRLTRGDVLQRVGELFQAPPGDPVAPGRVGVEVEWIAARPGAGRPEPVGVPELTALLGVDPHLVDQARLTFEPGGQLEISPAPADTAAAALEQVGEFSARLSRVLAGSGVELFSSGVNPWHGVDELGLQTPGPRYSAMQAHFDSIGEWGRGMMRQTAALQICIDLGGERTGLDRWRLTNLAGPALSATFANSPVREERITGMQSTRSRIWQGVEAARTGFDGTLVGGDVDQSVERYTAFAMAAPLIPLLTDADDPPPHAPFGEMMDGAVLQPADLDHHLSTLFPPVRPRGHLEVRYLDALPRRWLPAAVALLATLVYEQRSTRAALDVLQHETIDESAWRRAAVEGIRDVHLREISLALFNIALQGVTRLPEGFLPEDAERAMLAFRERFVAAGRAPADDQLDRFRDDPGDLDTWR